MTSEKSLILHTEEKDEPKFTFGYDNKIFIMGYRNFKVGNVIIKEIFLIGGLKHNLLSINQFTNKRV